MSKIPPAGRRLVLALVLFPALAVAQSSPLPASFLPGGAADEGCYAQWSTRSAVRAYSAPTPMSTPLRTVDAERRIDANDYSESLTAVLAPGLARVRRPITAEASRLGARAPERLLLSPGDEVAVLAPGGEGSVVFSVRGETYVGYVPGYDDGGGQVEVIRQPVTELWVRLVEHGPDRPAAWVNTAQAGMAPREPFCQ
ncbi:hypothetical protein [Rubrivirga sp.]|uniref:hypothetical protein n=1 Tax=Rubrivirga sp. TaxID=1885344 RepID=UPI003B523E2B